uniref:Uncharacterized protein n=1 Tax=Magallana gigas TaxID=29159 RepID=A0A8W8MML2_MAGGI
MVESHIIIRNESCSPSKAYKIRTQALEGILPGNKYQEGIHVQGTAHGMTIIELRWLHRQSRGRVYWHLV